MFSLLYITYHHERQLIFHHIASLIFSEMPVGVSGRCIVALPPPPYLDWICPLQDWTGVEDQALVTIDVWWDYLSFWYIAAKTNLSGFETTQMPWLCRIQPDSVGFMRLKLVSVIMFTYHSFRLLAESLSLMLWNWGPLSMLAGNTLSFRSLSVVYITESVSCLESLWLFSNVPVYF